MKNLKKKIKKQKQTKMGKKTNKNNLAFCYDMAAVDAISISVSGFLLVHYACCMAIVDIASFFYW